MYQPHEPRPDVPTHTASSLGPIGTGLDGKPILGTVTISQDLCRHCNVWYPAETPGELLPPPPGAGPGGGSRPPLTP